jgi:hypothetical protein
MVSADAGEGLGVRREHRMTGNDMDVPDVFFDSFLLTRRVSESRTFDVSGIIFDRSDGVGDEPGWASKSLPSPKLSESLQSCDIDQLQRPFRRNNTREK